MQCPIDNIDLVMTDRQGVEIDYCPDCRAGGVRHICLHDKGL